MNCYEKNMFSFIMKKKNYSSNVLLYFPQIIIIYIYAFSRCFYPKRFTVHSGYTCVFQYVIIIIIMIIIIAGIK